MVNCFSKVKPPWSVVLTRIVYEFLVSKSGLLLIVKLEPEIENEPLSVSPAPGTKLYVKTSLISLSVEDKVPTVELLATFSLIAEGESDILVGEVFTISEPSSVIVTVKV